MSNDKNQLIIPQITGYGLKGFEDNSDYFDKKLSNNLDNMKLIDAPMDLISTKMSTYVQESSYKKIHESQISKLNWVEKKFYINKDKESRLLKDRTEQSQKDALIVSTAFSVGKFILQYGVSYLLDRNRKTKFAKTTYQILSYVAATGNQISEHDQTIIHRVMGDMPVSDKHKKQIKTQIPTNILAIDHCDEIREFKQFIAGNIYKIFQNKGYSKNFILEEKRPIFELIGFGSRNELKDLIDFVQDDYVRLQIQNAGFQGILHSIFNDVAHSLKRNNENCIKNSMVLAAYDPFRETRQKNINTLKTGAKIATEIAIGVATGGKFAPVTGYALSKHFLVGTEDKIAKEMLPKFYEESLVKKGLGRNEILAFITEGEKIYKSAHA